MNFVLTFRPNTAAYRVHNWNCNRQMSGQVEVSRHHSREAAIAAAHADESSKGGAKADVKACRCCQPRSVS